MTPGKGMPNFERPPQPPNKPAHSPTWKTHYVALPWRTKRRKRGMKVLSLEKGVGVW